MKSLLLLAAVLALSAICAFAMVFLKLSPSAARTEAVDLASSVASGAPTQTAELVTPAEPLVSATPRPHRLAPEGELYLLERAAVTTSTGVTGFPTGTKVKLIREKGNTMTVSAHEMRFEVRSDKVTNDLDLADLAGRHDPDSEQALAKSLFDLRTATRGDLATGKKIGNQASPSPHGAHNDKRSASISPYIF